MKQMAKDSVKSNYENSRNAVDPVIFSIKDHKLLVYLNYREKEPFKGLAELPGGLLLKNETAEETLSRKLVDVLGSSKVFFEQFYTFTNPKRDPRTRTITIAFIALISSDKVSNYNHFFEYDELPDLAFDHIQIIQRAHAYLVQNLNHRFVQQFLPRYFSLNDLQMVHEVITKEKFDNRNFRKKMLSIGMIKKAKKVQKNVSHRPAELYEFI